MSAHGPLEPGQWWACEHPERPVGYGCVYRLFETYCWACRMKLEADIRNRGDFEVVRTDDRSIVMASEALERAS